MTRRIVPFLAIPLVAFVVCWAAWRTPVDGGCPSAAWATADPVESQIFGEPADESACLRPAPPSGVVSSGIAPCRTGGRRPAADPANPGGRPLSFLSGSLRISRPPPA